VRNRRGRDVNCSSGTVGDGVLRQNRRRKDTNGKDAENADEVLVYDRVVRRHILTLLQLRGSLELSADKCNPLHHPVSIFPVSIFDERAGFPSGWPSFSSLSLNAEVAPPVLASRDISPWRSSFL
jgi:hypothetical protein